MWWCFNAVLYATIICLTYYVALRDSLITYGLFSFGTIVFSGLLMSLLVKLAFMHNKWTWLQVKLIALSFGGLPICYIILEYSFPDFYGEADFLLGQGLFWLFGVFSMAVFTMILDVATHFTVLLFRPTREMLFIEIENNVSL